MLVWSSVCFERFIRYLLPPCSSVETIFLDIKIHLQNHQKTKIPNLWNQCKKHLTRNFFHIFFFTKGRNQTPKKPVKITLLTLLELWLWYRLSSHTEKVHLPSFVVSGILSLDIWNRGSWFSMIIFDYILIAFMGLCSRKEDKESKGIEYKPVQINLKNRLNEIK